MLHERRSWHANTVRVGMDSCEIGLGWAGLNYQTSGQWAVATGEAKVEGELRPGLPRIWGL